jgi:hypothetical protein
MNKLLLIILFFIVTTQLNASKKMEEIQKIDSELELMRQMATNYPDFFTIDESSIEIRKITDQELNKIAINKIDYIKNLNENFYSSKTFPKPNNAVIVDEIINIGKSIWAIVEKGKPVLNIQNDWAGAMPTGIEHWSQLDGWQKPRAENYSFTAKNGYGVNAINVIYRVIYTYGGGIRETGSYLTNVAVVPIHIDVLWGYTLDILVEVPSVFNTGSAKSPIGALQLFVKNEISTVLKTSIIGQTFFINGKGEFEDFNY